MNGNSPYPILVIEPSLYPIKSVAMNRYLMYKKNLYNMDTKRFPKVAYNSSKIPHVRLKPWYHKDAQPWLDHWGIKKDIIL